jgi:aryl-alcohol dehydrogenase-like predicted oxidoreductase
MTTIRGFATAQATREWASAAPAHYRESVDGLWLSSLGMGSYLGTPSAEEDAWMQQAAEVSVRSGSVNVLDSAINYRYQASERALGRAVANLVATGVARESLFLCSKNGYLTPDAAVTQSFQQTIQTQLIDTGIVNPDTDIVGGMHCMTPAFLADQLQRSLNNWGVETLDLMYLHNAAESQLAAVGPQAFMARLKDAFQFYELAREQGRIRYYGLATWSCFRVPPDAEDYLSLEAVIDLAHQVGGDHHGCRFIQLPFNLALTEAATLPTQPVAGRPCTLLEAAELLGIGVFASVPLMQSQLLAYEAELPRYPGLETPAQRCLQFVRSTPGIVAPLVGHKRAEHVLDNLQVAKVPADLQPAD